MERCTYRRQQVFNFRGQGLLFVALQERVFYVEGRET